MDPVGASASGLPAAAAKGGADPSTLRQIRKLSQEFEAILVNEMLKSMRSTMPKGGLFRSGSSQTVYQQMADEEVARALARGRGVGLADVLTRELGRLSAGKTSSSAGSGSPIGTGERSQGSDGGQQ